MKKLSKKTRKRLITVLCLIILIPAALFGGFCAWYYSCLLYTSLGTAHLDPQAVADPFCNILAAVCRKNLDILAVKIHLFFLPFICMKKKLHLRNRVPPRLRFIQLFHSNVALRKADRYSLPLMNAHNHVCRPSSLRCHPFLSLAAKQNAPCATICNFRFYYRKITRLFQVLLRNFAFFVESIYLFRRNRVYF